GRSPSGGPRSRPSHDAHIRPMMGIQVLESLPYVANLRIWASSTTRTSRSAVSILVVMADSSFREAGNEVKIRQRAHGADDRRGVEVILVVQAGQRERERLPAGRRTRQSALAPGPTSVGAN